MQLNAVEKVLMNNPLRAAVQRHVEARVLVDLAGPVPAPRRALEIGCGRGVGVDIVFDRFGAERVDAFDLDPHMVALARARLAHRGDRSRVWLGDAERIDAPDASYDAVFDFGIIHHIPRWREALREVHRVLQPGGRFYLEEVLRAFIVHLVTRAFLDHPLEDRFDDRELACALEEAGFVVRAQRQLLGSFAWFVAEKPLDAGAAANAAGSEG